MCRTKIQIRKGTPVEVYIFFNFCGDKEYILYSQYTIIILDHWALLLVSSIQYYIHYSISLSEKIEAKRERDNFGRAFFNTAGGRYSLENNGTGYISLYGLGGLIGREVDNQDRAGPR